MTTESAAILQALVNPYTAEKHGEQWQVAAHAWDEAMISAQRALAASPLPVSGSPILTWQPMETAPKDGVMLRLLVDFTDNATEDSAEPCPTMGANNLAHDGIDAWQFAGWNWQQDCFTEGVGVPVGWLPLVEVAALVAVPGQGEPVERIECEECGMGYRHALNCPIGNAPKVNMKCGDCLGPVGEDHSDNCGIGRGPVLMSEASDFFPWHGPAKAVQPAPASGAISDEPQDLFDGDDTALCDSIHALLALDKSGSLVPHGIGGHARTLLATAALRLAAQPAPQAHDQTTTGEKK